MNIKDIALRVAEETDAAYPWNMNQDKWIVKFAEALVAELAKENEPVCFYDGNKFYSDEKSAICSCADITSLRALYTTPQPDRTAELEAALKVKCDDKMGKIARQSVEIDSLKEQVAQLELEKEYRYVENILRPIRILLKVAECAESLADNSEEMEGEDGRIHVGMAADFDELSDALDLLDELPDDKPGYVLGAAAKAAWALHDIIGDTND